MCWRGRRNFSLVWEIPGYAIFYKIVTVLKSSKTVYMIKSEFSRVVITGALVSKLILFPQHGYIYIYRQKSHTTNITYTHIIPEYNEACLFKQL